MNTYNEQQIVRTIYADLNGDGYKEKVVLTGVPVEKDCNFLESLALSIECEGERKKQFNLQENGIGFNIFTVNVTNYNAEQILLVGNYNKGGVFDTIKILKYENDNLKLLFDSKSFFKKVNYKTKYLNDYKIEIICENTQEQYILDISNAYNEYLINNYDEHGAVISNKDGINYSIDNVFPVKLPNNDYYSLMIQQGVRLNEDMEKLGGVQTLIDINDMGEITILDQYLITKA